MCSNQAIILVGLLSPERHGKNIDSGLLQSVYFEGDTSAELIVNLFGKCNKCNALVINIFCSAQSIVHQRENFKNPFTAVDWPVNMTTVFQTMI